MTSSRKFIQKLFDAHGEDVFDMDHLDTTVNAVSGCLISLSKNFPEQSPKFEGIRATLLAELKLFKDDYYKTTN